MLQVLFYCKMKNYFRKSTLKTAVDISLMNDIQTHTRRTDDRTTNCEPVVARIHEQTRSMQNVFFPHFRYHSTCKTYNTFCER